MKRMLRMVLVTALALTFMLGINSVKANAGVLDKAKNVTLGKTLTIKASDRFTYKNAKNYAFSFDSPIEYMEVKVELVTVGDTTKTAKQMYLDGSRKTRNGIYNEKTNKTTATFTFTCKDSGTHIF